MENGSFLPKPGDKVFDRFMLKELVGIGPVSGVFRADDLALNKEVMLKYFYPGLASTQVRENNLFRLYRARGFLHRNLVHLQEVFVGDNLLIVTKDIVDGISLRAFHKIKQEALEPFTKKEVVNLVFEVCEALRMIHMLGANGNLKPENILLTETGLRIDDPYSLAGRSAIPPEHGSFLLADRYVAPEQLQDPMSERKESDIYALALIVGEVLIGKPVRPAVALSDQGPIFSGPLDELFLKATASDPSARYLSISAFWDAVRQVFGVPPEEFTASRTPIGFIPEALSDRVRAVKTIPGYVAAPTMIMEAIRPEVLAAIKATAPTDVQPKEQAPVVPPMLQEVTAEVDAVDVPQTEQSAEPVILMEAADEAPSDELEMIVDVAPAVPPASPEVVQETIVGEASPEPSHEAETVRTAEDVAVPPLVLEYDEIPEAELAAYERRAPDAVEVPPVSSQPDEGAAEPEIDVAETLPRMPASDVPLELASDGEPPSPPPIEPGTTDAEDAAMLSEIEKIIEESKEFDALEGTADGIGVGLPQPAEEVSDVVLSASEDLGDAEIIEGDEAEEGDEGELIEAEAMASEDSHPVVPLPEPQPVEPDRVWMSPKDGYRPDAEFWRLRLIEEDQDLEDLMDVSAPTTTHVDMVVIGETIEQPAKPQPKAAPAAAPTVIGEPQKPAVAPIVTAPPPAKVIKPAAKPQQPAKSNMWIWIIIAIIVLGGGGGLVAYIMDKTKTEDEIALKAKKQKEEQAKAKAEADKKALEESEARIAEENRKAEDARLAKEKADREAQDRKARDAAEKKAEEAKLKAQQEADAQKKAEEARKVKEEADKAEKALAEARGSGLKALEPLVAASATYKGWLSVIEPAVAGLDKELAELTALPAKDQKKVKDRIDLLTRLTTDGKKAAKAVADASAELAALGNEIQNAASIDKMKVDDARQKGLQTKFTEAGDLAAAWLVEWYGLNLAQSLKSLEDKAQDLPAKAKELDKAGATDGKALVEALDKRVAERVEVIKKDTSAPVTKATEADVKRLQTASEETTGLLAEVDKALAMTATSVVGPEVTTGPEVPADPKAAEIAALDKEVSMQLKTVRGLIDSLGSKATAWNKAGNPAKEKDALEAKKELDQISKDLKAVQDQLKAGKLDEAKAAWAVVKPLVPPLVDRGKQLAAEKLPNETETPVGPATPGDNKAELQAKKCPGSMKQMIIKNSDKASGAPKYIGYCIDYYEFPGKGSMPKTGVSWEAANAACAAQGKRLCKKAEWTAACGGKYPYGSTYNPEACNTAGDDGLGRPVQAAGSRPECRSPYGLYDMVGNVSEWVFEKAVAGGDSAKGDDTATCGRVSPRYNGGPSVGFRCCADLQ